MTSKVLIALTLASISYFVTDIAPFAPYVAARNVQVSRAVIACMSWDAAPAPDTFSNCRVQDIARVIPGGFDNSLKEAGK